MGSTVNDPSFNHCGYYRLFSFLYPLALFDRGSAAPEEV